MNLKRKKLEKFVINHVLTFELTILSGTDKSPAVITTGSFKLIKEKIQLYNVHATGSLSWMHLEQESSKNTSNCIWDLNLYSSLTKLIIPSV